MIRRFGFALRLIVAALLLGAAPAHANGWEHQAIPLEALLGALQGEDAALRARAAESLGIRKQQQAVGPLLALLEREAAPQVRSAIYGALGSIGDPQAVPALVHGLQTQQREELRADAATALGRLGAPEGLPPLLHAAQRDPSIIVRTNAVAALGAFDQPEAIAALTDLLRGSNQNLRLRAIHALGTTGASAAVPALLDALGSAATDAERSAIVNAFARLRAKEARQPLEQLLATTSDPALRVRLVAALGAIRDGSALPTLVRLLDDPQPGVRFYALDGLTGLRDAAAAAPILAFYERTSKRLAAASPEQLRADAATTLAEYALLISALRALIALDPAAGLPAFLDAAKERAFGRDSAVALKLMEAVYELRRLGLVGLGYTGAREAADFIAGSGVLADPDPRLRAAAVRALAVVGFPDAAAQLLPMLRDASADVRFAAAAALGRLGDAQAVEPLVAALSDPHAIVRREAALGLGYLKQPAAVDRLRRVAEADNDAQVRAAAKESLRLLEGSQTPG